MSSTTGRGAAPAPSPVLRRRRVWLGAFVVAVLAGCAGSGDALPTPVPSPPPARTTVALDATATTAMPSTPQVVAAEPTETPVPAPTPAPTAIQPEPPAQAPPASPVPASPAPSYEPITLTVTARDIRFLPGSLTIPAHVAVTLVMDNQDAGVLHDVAVNVVGGGRTETCEGPCQSSFVFAAHVPGSYHFFCSLHPEMVGELRVTE